MRVSARAPSSRALARVLMVCAVLTGLFLMHGLATLDCGGAAGTSPPSMKMSSMPSPPMGMPATVSAASGGVHVASMMGHEAGASPTIDTRTSGHGTGMAGGVCVSAPPRSGLTGLLALLLAAGAVVVAATTTLPNRLIQLPHGHGRRAPPLAGPAMLARLCISRT